MLYKNIKVDEINILIDLKEDHEDNEEYVLNLLIENKVGEQIEIENPIDKLVYLQPLFLDACNITDEGIGMLIRVFNQIKKIFKNISNVSITLHLDGFITEGLEDFNEVDVDIDEFLTLIEY